MQIDKAKLLNELRTLLVDVFHQNAKGVATRTLGRAHGYADGYMKALLTSGIATKEELLRTVQAARTEAMGPATTSIVLDEVDTSAA